MSDQTTGIEIAIIGMTGRFPGAPSLEDYWQNLRDGVESVRFLDDAELLARGVDPALLRDPDYVKASAQIDDIESFDAAFFGLSHREAEITDPQQRIFLECAWSALEHAGYNPETYDGGIGVFGGATLNTYLLLNLASNQRLIDSLDPVAIDIGNAGDYLTTRISYKLNLKGPSHTIQSACSTSLVAIHVACQSLLNDECDLALAGGVSINVQQRNGYRFMEGGIASPDGHCRPFDASAQGTIFGSGVGVVVLKRLEDALADGDTIHAVIKGSAINNDGSLKVGYTAPSVDGQAQVVTEALGYADVDPATISYIEAHGTGTALGDPIEIQALTKAFRASTDASGFCAVGSVKSNIGHLGAAAGVASLIKATLALKHRQLPPSLNFERPSPDIDFASSPFYVNAKLKDWTWRNGARRAGVSSFGVGGTNAHVILEEAPTPEPTDPARPWQLLTLSAKSSAALDTMTAALAEQLKRNPDLNLADVAYTLHIGRQHFNHRRVVVCRDREDAIDALDVLDIQRVSSAAQQMVDRPVTFLFTGQGAQYVNMGRELYETEAIFRESIDRCCELLEPHLGLDLRDFLYPTNEAQAAATEQLDQTQITQPALFVIEYALAQLWQAWGVTPSAMIGHSIGEYVAATLAGVFALEDALLLVAARGRLMQTLPQGAMLAVPLPAVEVQPLLGLDLSLAAINGPSQCVVSGPTTAIGQLEAQLAAQGLNCRRLHTSHAFHSAMMDPILDAFAAQFERVRLQPPQIPFVSNVTGDWISAEDATNPRYWARHLRQTVRFEEGTRALLKEVDTAFLEIGPGHTLSRLIKRHPNATPDRVAVSSLRQAQEQQSDLAFAQMALGKLWLAGVTIDWAGVHSDERRRRVPLPTYPFERRRYWIEPQKQADVIQAQPAATGKQADLADWFYLPSWQRSLPSQAAPTDDLRPWLIFLDDSMIGAGLARRLRQSGREVITVQRGESFGKESGGYTLNPAQPDDYGRLLDALRSQDKQPGQIVHLWSLASQAAPIDDERFEQAQHQGFGSLLALARAIGGTDAENVRITALASQMHDVTGAEAIDPAKATLLAACTVIPQEYPQISCRSIDVAIPTPGIQTGKLLDQLAAELGSASNDRVVAYRGNQRWVQTFEQVRLDEQPEAQPLRPRGVYLITGGLHGVGLALADELARQAQARLVLVDELALPARAQWSQWLATHPDHDATSRAIGSVQALEQHGAEVLALKADVADLQQLRDVIRQSIERFDTLHGVIHAASAPGDRFFQPLGELDHAACAAHFQPKVAGLLALREALADQDLDFCALDSSLATVLGGLGYAAYAAANLFMNAFAHQQSSLSRAFWVSVNWDAWQLDDQRSQITAVSSDLAQMALTPEEGGAAFRRILALRPGDQIIVSTGDLLTRIEQQRSRVAALREHAQPAAEGSTAQLHPRPKLQNPYVAPGSELERAIAEVWQQSLGFEQIGVHDNFFDLGGDSFIAVHVIAQMKKALQRDIPVASLYAGLTIRSLADILAADEAQPIEQTIAQVEAREEKASRRKQMQQMQRSKKRLV
ncbi:MAG: acyltransferase domain-containing protein [Chloroflexi bacterium]|nr:acyltransferase domain-containing protein [Chloroflexota bacterium]